MKISKVSLVIVVMLASAIGSLALAQDEQPKQVFGTTNSPNGSEPEDLIAFAERTTLEENQKLILRTINFMVSESSIDEYLSSMGELMPDQVKSLNKEHDSFQRKAKEIRSNTSRILAAYEKTYGRLPNPGEIESIVEREVKKAEVEFYSNVSNELLRHQKLVIANWRPTSIGISKTLTDTPIGKTIGLSKKQLEKIRDRSDEIGTELEEAFDKAQTEFVELYEGVLTEEQAKKIKELYYPNSDKRMPFTMMSPTEMIGKLPYRYDSSKN